MIFPISWNVKGLRLSGLKIFITTNLMSPFKKQCFFYFFVESTAFFTPKIKSYFSICALKLILLFKNIIIGIPTAIVTNWLANSNP